MAGSWGRSRVARAGRHRRRARAARLGMAAADPVDDRSIGSSPATRGRFEYRELDVESAAGQALRDWQLADDVLIEPVGPIVPAVSSGDPYYPGRRRSASL